MTKKPFFSIVIPTYNRASDLQFALYCIFQQGFSDFEIIISDNCSADDTRAVVAKLKNEKIRYFRNNKNVDFAQSAKKAIRYAKGEYVFLHSDDDFLLYSDSLQEIYNEIIKTSAGYVRLNYICLSPDKKRLFHFKVNKPFVGNKHLPPFLKNKEILSFILASDPYFITGIIFKNNLPAGIGAFYADPAPWIEILFYVTEKFGACFIAKRNVVASWSRWQIDKNGGNRFYSLRNEKLKSESYFNAVQKKIDKKEYRIFLHNQLMLMFVNLLPVIKVVVGNKNMLELSKRIRLLDQTMKKSFVYWTYLIGALILPGFFLKFVKNTYLYIYIRLSKVDNEKEIINRLKELKFGFLHARGNISKSKD